VKTTEKIDNTPIVVQHSFANLSAAGRTSITKTGEFRLIDCHFNHQSNKAEINCFAGASVRATVPAVHLPRLETWLGRVVSAEFNDQDIDNERPLSFLRIEPIEHAHNPLLTARPGWIARGHESHFIELQALVESLNAPYQELVFQCLRDDLILESLLGFPASLGHHHHEAGGLLRHTVEVAMDCAQACQSYKATDFSLAVTAALLHDIGKCLEYSRGTGGRFSRSQAGELEMHKVQGAMIIKSAANACGSDPILVSEIIHCVTAANGQDYMGLARPKLFAASLVQTADARSSAADLYQTRSKFAFDFSKFGGSFANRGSQPIDLSTTTSNLSIRPRRSPSLTPRPSVFKTRFGRGK
jgi:putative nucleotidyltransferase with HDIG domain